jgi:putative redox protein
MHVTVKHVDGMIIEGRGQFGCIAKIGSIASGFDVEGVSPMELLLMGAAGCSGIDIVSILQKMRMEYKSFEICVEGTRAQDHPRVFTEIHITYKFQGTDLPEKKLKRAIDLSIDKYCSAINMLNKVAKITFTLEIN